MHACECVRVCVYARLCVRVCERACVRACVAELWEVCFALLLSALCPTVTNVYK